VNWRPELAMSRKKRQDPRPEAPAAPPSGNGVWWVLGGMFGGWAVGVFVALRLFADKESAQPWIALGFVFAGIFVGAFLGWRRAS
jgi:hypothetical protein